MFDLKKIEYESHSLHSATDAEMDNRCCLLLFVNSDCTCMNAGCMFWCKQEEALHMVHCFDDDHGLGSIVSSCTEVVQLSNQLSAKTEQYLKHFSVIAASDDGTANTS